MWDAEIGEILIYKLKYISKSDNQKHLVINLNKIPNFFIDESKLSRWKSGQTIPNIEELLTISEYYKCTIDFLLSAEDMEKIDKYKKALRDMAKYAIDILDNCINSKLS